MTTAPAAPFRTRPDLTSSLVHFTRGPTRGDAFRALSSILSQRRLLGGDGFIRGSYRCVCFTEAPLQQLCEIFWWSSQEELRFQPFGILVDKAWLFAKGGRPVIYQSDAEFTNLPENLRYRHVRYEPNTSPPIDFTWEREWRIHTDELALDPSQCQVIVLSDEYRQTLEDEYRRAQGDYIYSLSLAIGDSEAAKHETPFPWQVLDLDSLRPDWHYAQFYEEHHG